jgi:hypothetical protein
MILIRDRLARAPFGHINLEIPYGALLGFRGLDPDAR